MSTINKLSSSLGRRDDVPNQELAQKIAQQNDSIAVKELVDNLSNKDKNIQSDCIKTLYEISYLNPTLIAGYCNDFLALLDSKNNRLAWGAMIALDSITAVQSQAIYKALPKLLSVADSGSVITRDHVVGILIKLASFKQYEKSVFPELIRQMQTCPTNQLPMYAEQAMPVINKNNGKEFITTLTNRLDRIDQESKKKRIEKVIKKVSSTIH